MKYVFRGICIVVGVLVLVAVPHGTGPTDGSEVVTQPIVLFNWANFLKTLSYTVQHFFTGKTIDGRAIFPLVMSHLFQSVGVLITAFIIVFTLGTMKGIYDGIRVANPTRLSFVSEMVQAFVESLPDFFLICTLEFLSIMLWIHSKVNIPIVSSTSFGTGVLLPGIIVSILPCMYLARMTRMSAENQLGQQYLVTARAKGLSWGYILRKHLVPNTYSTILSATVPVLGMMFSSLVIVEYLLAKPGIINGIYESLGEFGGDMVYKPVDGNPHLVSFTMNDPALILAYLMSAVVLLLCGWFIIRSLLALGGYRGVRNPYTSTFRPPGWTGRMALPTGIVMGVILLGVALFRPWLHLPDPSATDILENLPGGDFRMAAYPPLTGPHILGSDYIGHDLLSEAIQGTFPTLEHLIVISLTIIFLAIILATLAGIWRMRIIRSVIEVLNLLFTIVPGVLACLFILDMPNVFWFGSHVSSDQIVWDIRHVILFIAVVSLTEVGRVASALCFTLEELSNKSYMEAAEISGNSPWGKFVRHGLRTFSQSVLEQTVITMSRVLLLVSTLGFFSHSMTTSWSQSDSLSAVSNTHVVLNSDWPSLIAQNAHDWFHYPWVSFAPVLFITYTVLMLNFIRLGVLSRMESEPKPRVRVNSSATVRQVVDVATKA